jgi:hypothetical protein
MYIYIGEYYSDLALNKITEVETTQSAKRQIISQRTWLISSTRPGIYNCISFYLMSKKVYQFPNSTFSLLVETSF